MPVGPHPTTQTFLYMGGLDCIKIGQIFTFYILVLYGVHIGWIGCLIKNMMKYGSSQNKYVGICGNSLSELIKLINYFTCKITNICWKMEMSSTQKLVPKEEEPTKLRLKMRI